MYLKFSPGREDAAYGRLVTRYLALLTRLRDSLHRGTLSGYRACGDKLEFLHSNVLRPEMRQFDPVDPHMMSPWTGSLPLI